LRIQDDILIDAAGSSTTWQRVPDFYISYACLICARNEKNNSVNCVVIQYINKILLKYEEGEAKYKSYRCYQYIENV